MPSPEDCGLLQGLFEAVEAERTAQERAWGFGRLEALAGRDSPDLLARFRRQQVTWSDVYQAAWSENPLTAGRLAEVQAKARSMQRGWLALATFAAEAGHREIAPWVWEAQLADGQLVALVQTEAEVGKVKAEGRYAQVWTAQEIGRLIDDLAGALADSRPKGKPPRKAIPNDLQAPPWSDAGDDIPFGNSEGSEARP